MKALVAISMAVLALWITLGSATPTWADVPPAKLIGDPGKASHPCWWAVCDEDRFSNLPVSRRDTLAPAKRLHPNDDAWLSPQRTLSVTRTNTLAPQKRLHPSDGSWIMLQRARMIIRHFIFPF